MLYFAFTEYLQPVAASYNESYKENGFEIVGRYISYTPISFGREAGSRLDLAFKIFISKDCSFKNKCVSFGCTYSYDSNTEVQF